MNSHKDEATGTTIEVSQAQVLTVAVEVKTLTIRGRQMTLSVFRQLRREPLIDLTTVELRGTPWGLVHYFPAPCDQTNPATHLHVVWQKGAELRRACVDELRGDAQFRPLELQAHRLKDRVFDAWLLRYACAAAINPDSVEEVTSFYGPGAWKIRIGAGVLTIPAPTGELCRLIRDCLTCAKALRNNRGAGGNLSYLEDHDRRSTAALAEYVATATGTSGQAAERVAVDRIRSLELQLTQTKAAVDAAYGKYQDLYDQLASLPQLFIAT